MHRRVAVIGMLAASLVFTSSAAADLDEVNSKKLRDGVTVNGILQHERAFQQIANLNGGTRSSGTPGYQASLRLREVAPAAGGLPRDRAGVHVPVLPRARAGRARADGADADDLRDRHVHVLRQRRRDRAGPGGQRQRVPADRRSRARPRVARTATSPASSRAGSRSSSAARASSRRRPRTPRRPGAAAVIIFNEGQPGRDELFIGTAGRPFTIPIVGAELRGRAGAPQPARGRHRGDAARRRPRPRPTSTPRPRTCSRSPSRATRPRRSWSARTSTPSPRARASTTTAPARPRSSRSPRRWPSRRSRRAASSSFAFWGAEEFGLLGSEYYVANLPLEELAQHRREPELRHGRLAELRAVRL